MTRDLRSLHTKSHMTRYKCSEMLADTPIYKMHSGFEFLCLHPTQMRNRKGYESPEMSRICDISGFLVL